MASSPRASSAGQRRGGSSSPVCGSTTQQCSQSAGMACELCSSVLSSSERSGSSPARPPPRAQCPRRCARQPPAARSNDRSRPARRQARVDGLHDRVGTRGPRSPPRASSTKHDRGRPERTPQRLVSSAKSPDAERPRLVSAGCDPRRPTKVPLVLAKSSSCHCRSGARELKREAYPARSSGSARILCLAPHRNQSCRTRSSWPPSSPVSTQTSQAPQPNAPWTRRTQRRRTPPARCRVRQPHRGRPGRQLALLTGLHHVAHHQTRGHRSGATLEGPPEIKRFLVPSGARWFSRCARRISAASITSRYQIGRCGRHALSGVWMPRRNPPRRSRSRPVRSNTPRLAARWGRPSVGGAQQRTRAPLL